MDRKTDVVIVGAGIAGLALAFELQKRNISTLLLDRRKTPDSAPRGITFQPNGLEALEKLGILDRVIQLGSVERILEVKDWNRELLLEADYSVLDHPQNYITTVNAVQIEQLLGYKAENLGAQTVWGAGYREIIWDNGLASGVRCDFEGEITDFPASVVIGADGPQSRIRTAIGAVSKVTKYPDSFLVGLTGPVEELTDRARQYQAPRKMLGIMPAGADASYFFYCVGDRSFDDLKREGLGSFKTEITEAAPELDRSFSDVEAWSRIAYFTPSFIRVTPWVGNGVALLGDSAHTFHPHSGQGVNLSLQDALALAEVIEGALKTGDTSAKRLMEYQTRRKMFADVIGQHAHYTATYALSSNWLIRRLNRRALRKMQKNRKLMKKALEVTAGVFSKKPGLIEQARIGGILP
ncbi:MAG TPA: NAD(P)/FAD-dependent oxidoreductase [Candidatus Bathyarchaeia archaeon]|nr:NAD(P)/FAD-dependent oxidoreductase [Candidatus Bathyarchaeia archaeon]